MKKYFTLLLVTLYYGTQAQQNSDTAITKLDTLNQQVYRVSNTERFIYTKTKFSDLYKKIPTNIWSTAKDMVSSSVYPYSIAAVGATAALVPADPFLTRNARSLGIQMGFEYDHSYKKLGPLEIIPSNINTTLYFLGNGTAVMLMGAGFATYGFIAKDYRAQSVSTQLVQSIIVSGVFSQTLKRITGEKVLSSL